jgi:ADP-ribose pyrophosphatase
MTDPAAGPGATAVHDPRLFERRTGGTVLHGGGWLELRRDEVTLPDGTAATREYIAHPGAVAVLPLLDDGSQGEPRVVLVRQYRYPVGHVLLELPAGKRDPGETTLACAMRELLEETGYTAAEWAYAGEIHNAAAYSTESIWLWFARGLRPGPQRLDVGEFVEVVTCTEPELDALAAGSGLPDVKTRIGLHWLQRWRAGAWPLRWQAAADAAQQEPQPDPARTPPPRNP